ncbi:MAG: ferritin-like domain-containing protein [Acidimicrobiia bacterium]|nr:ferritin-like domain-containing protein [Acidimicrobiia bacterium]
MKLDERAFRDLLAESNDLHLDAQRGVPESLRQLEARREERRHDGIDLDEIARYNATRRSVLAGGGAGGLAWLSRGVLAGGFGSALSALLSSPARADEALDIQILQTAVSLETLAVATYGAALELDFIRDGNPVIITFAQTTMEQHGEHRDAFNAQTRSLGGAEQTQPNPKYAPIVEAAKPNLRAPGDVVMLAAAIEIVATQTYVKNASLLADPTTKALMASVTGVEAQHLATLRAVGGLLGSGLPELVALPTDVDRLPAAAGSLSFPKPFEGTEMASPPQEGAVE